MAFNKESVNASSHKNMTKSLYLSPGVAEGIIHVLLGSPEVLINQKIKDMEASSYVEKS